MDRLLREPYAVSEAVETPRRNNNCNTGPARRDPCDDPRLGADSVVSSICGVSRPNRWSTRRAWSHFRRHNSCARPHMGCYRVWFSQREGMGMGSWNGREHFADSFRYYADCIRQLR